MSVTIKFDGVNKLGVKMRRFMPAFTRKEQEAQEQAAERLLQEIIIGASGPPGPNVQTGSYRSSWFKIYNGTLLGWKVATNAPQAARLEYGFFGTDALGRNYMQAARPHVRPAIVRVTPAYKKLYAAVPGEAWRAT